MKLLFDQNLSPELVARLADVYPGSAHVQGLGLDRAGDDAIWGFARDHGFAIVTEDSDYSDLGVVKGFRPKVVRPLTGKCTTARVESLLRAHHASLMSFEHDPSVGTIGLR